MCVFHLQEVGCDCAIDSNAVEDRCGVCLGDGTSCETVYKSFDEEEGFGEYLSSWKQIKLSQHKKSCHYKNCVVTQNRQPINEGRL